MASPAPGPDGPLRRNSTSFPARATAALRRLLDRYRAARADPADPEHGWASSLKYYQFLARAYMSEAEFGVGAPGNARGLLVYLTMGMGKTREAVAVAMALWEARPVVVMLARSLRRNFGETVAEVVGLLHPGAPPGELARLRAEAAARVEFASMDAYNSADQVAGARRPRGRPAAAFEVAPGGLDGKLLVVDEAHNFFRAIINSSSATSNARRVYEMVMGARDLRLLFLTGTPAAKDPFELVPCFNMLAGHDLLPTQYEAFYKLYVDREAHAVRNRGLLANRLLGLVSHVSHSRPSEPAVFRPPPPGTSVLALDAGALRGAVADPAGAYRPLAELEAMPGLHVFALAPQGASAGSGDRASARAFAAHALLAPAAGPHTPPLLAAAAPAGALWLGELFAAEAFRGRGFGAAAASAAVAAAGRAGAPVAAVVREDAGANAGALILGRLGFEAAGVDGGWALFVLPAARARAGGPRLPRDAGWFPEELPLVIERVPMGAHQYRRYLAARELEEAEGRGGAGGRRAPPVAGPALSLPGAEKKAARSYFVRSRGLSTFCPPRELEGKPLAALPDSAFTAETAPKLALIAERAERAPGPVLVYSQFVENGGLRALSRFLLLRGFRAFSADAAVGGAPGGAPMEDAARTGEGAPDFDTFSVGGRSLYDTKKVWHLTAELPAEEIPTERLCTFVFGPAPGAAEKFAELAARLAGSPEHAARIDAANLSFPLLAVRRAGALRDDVLADGIHRLARAMRDRIPSLQVRWIPPEVLEAARIHEIEDGPAAPGVSTFSIDGRRFYDTKKVWALTAETPAEEIPTGRLRALLDEPQWGEEGPTLSAAEVLARPADFPDHAARIDTADLSFPLLVVSVRREAGPLPGGDRDALPDFVIADGMHRLARATRDNVPSVRVRRIPPEVLDAAFFYEEADDGEGGRVEVGPPPPRLIPLEALAAEPAEFRGALEGLIRQHRNEAEFRLEDLSLERPGRAQTLAVALGRGSGLPAAVARLDSAPGTLGRVSLVFTSPASRGRGLCRAVVGALAAGGTPLWLEVAADNAAAIACFSRLGFVFAGRAGDGLLRMERLAAPAEPAPAEPSPAEPSPAEPAPAAPAGCPCALAARAPAAGGAGPLRFAIISGDVPNETRDALVATFNSPENSHGAVIKALLVSKTGAEGLDLKWIRETHAVESYWDQARLDQVVARAVRMGAHDGLPWEERVVQPYLYLAAPNRAVFADIPAKDREARTIDEVFYARAQERFATNAAFRTLLAEVSLECESFGYGNCHACAPTDVPLFRADPLRDASLPDPCEPCRAHDVEAEPVEVGGRTYYAAPDGAGGFLFYVEHPELGGFAAVDPSDPALPALVRRFGLKN